jgi:uncharacterized repeat protein (TIGR01451 family)
VSAGFTLNCRADADIAVGISAVPSPVTVGNQLTYSITVTNLGPDAATGVVVTNTLPAGVTFVSTSCSQSSPVAGVLICAVGDLAAAANATVTVMVSPSSAGILNSSVQAGANESDPDTSNNTAISSVTANPLQTDLAVLVTASPDPATVGDLLVYNITVTNQGPNPATGVTLTNTFPPECNFVTSSCSSFTATDAAVICQVGNLGVGSSSMVTVTVSPFTTGSLFNTAQVVADQTDPNTGNNIQTTATSATAYPVASVASISTVEGNSGSHPVTFTITLSVPSSQTVTLNYATSDGTAMAPSDYQPASGTVTFPPGTTAQGVTVQVNGDLLNEADEYFFFTLTNPVNTGLSQSQALCTILNDDPLPSVSIADLAVLEGNSGTTNAVFTVSLSPVSGRSVSVGWQTIDGTAVAPGDYTAAGPATITFAAGETTKTITVSVNGDTLNEADETFQVLLFNPANATLARSAATGTILNDDPAPTLTISDVSVVEGNSGSTNAVFTLTLSAPSGQNNSVTYATADGTATAPTDYSPLGPATLSFGPGETVKTIPVAVNGDTLYEPNESFQVVLSNPVNLALGRPAGVGTILNDDPPPSITIQDVSVFEGNSGTTPATFVVNLSNASGLPASVTYNTVDGSATAPEDYISQGPATLTFAPGQTSLPITILVNGNTLNELDETFQVVLSNPVNATIGRGTATGTIVNDDPLPSINIQDASVLEGNTGTTNALFSVSLSAASGRTVSVTYATLDGTAVAPGDYLAQGATTLTFGAGETNKTIAVPVNGDTVYEPDESFQVVLSNPVNATLARSTATGTIVNDDPAPSLSIQGVSVAEGNSGTTNAVFTVNLSGQSSYQTSVNYQTGDGTAQAGTDYAALTGILVLPPGTMSGSITVQVNGDTLYEADETFVVTLSNPTHAVLGTPAQATGTILNDDPPPSLAINDISVLEGNSGTTPAVFTVTLSAASSFGTTVDYATAGGTATQGVDFVGASGTLTFPPGTLTQPITVAVNGDTLNEPDETFTVTLTNPVQATIAKSVGQGTILNDDSLPSISIQDVSLLEGNSGTTNAVFPVSLSAPSGQTVSVTYATTDGSAVAPSDYIALPSSTLTFAPGETNKTISVTVNGDTSYEPNETFQVLLSSQVNAILFRSSATGTILNDDPPPGLTIQNVQLLEGNSGTTNAILTVSLSPVSAYPAMVSYQTSDGTAVAGSDYIAGSGTLSFPPGTTNQTISVVVNGDTVYEADEVFYVSLLNPVNANLANPFQASVTILNDDAPPVMSINDVSILEGNSGTTNAVFTVSLSSASGLTASAQYTTSSGTATQGVDFLPALGTVTLAAGTTNATINVAVVGDTINEADETFFVTLSNPNQATLGKSVGQGTILNDDPVPSLSINDVTVTEGDSGTLNATFTVSLSPVSGQSVTVNYATADATALAGSDYRATTGSLTFPPGSTNQVINVPIVGDLIPEPTETFTVVLSAPVNASIARNPGTGTILDNDALALSFSNASLITIPLIGAATPYPSTIDLSGLPGQIGKLTVTLNGLSHTYPRDVQVLLVAPTGQNSIVMANAGGSAAVSGASLTFDDTALSSLPQSGQIFSGTFKPTSYPPAAIFPSPAPSGSHPSQLSLFNGMSPNGTWSLYVFDDASGDDGSIANGWTLGLALTNVVCCPSGTSADVSLTLTDSPDPSVVGQNLTYTATVINNGPADASGVTMSMQLPASTSYFSTSVSQGFSTVAGSTVVCNLGTLTVGSIATARVVVTPTAAVTVTCSATVSAAQADGNTSNNSASATTTVNLAPPAFSITDVSLPEGNVAPSTAMFTVTLSRAASQTVTVDYFTVGGSAISGIDFEPASGTLNFPPGTTSLSIPVTTYGDLVVEPNETFYVNLSNATGGTTIARSPGIGTLINDDGIPGQVDHFTWDPIVSPQKGAQSFQATVRAFDINNTLVSTFAGPVQLSGLTGTGLAQSILISEIDTGDSDQVEFSNVSLFSWDLSEWIVTLYDWVSWPDPAQTFVFPSGTVCPPGGIFVLADQGVAPGSYPYFYTGANLYWDFDPGTNQVAVLLRTANGQVIDFACAVDGYPSSISTPLSIPFTQWSSGPIGANTDPSMTYQRVGSSDNNSASDWVIAPGSIGARNSGITLPFAGPQPVAIAPSASGSFAGGIWTGNITVSQAATNMSLKANDGNGHIGLSGTFSVTAPNQPPTISSIAAQVSNEDTPTAAIPFTVSDPDTPLTSLVLLPSSSDPTIVPVGNITFGGSGGNRTVTVLPATNAFGTATITIGVTDGTSTNAASFLLTVNSVNDPPVFVKGPDQAILEDAGSQSKGEWATGISPGPANEASQTVNFIVTNNLPALFLVQPSISPTGTLTYTTATNANGVATVTVQLHDSGGMANGGINTSAPQTFAINVTPVNDAPSFSKGADQTVLEDGGPQSVANWATGISVGPPDEASQSVNFIVTNSLPALFLVQPAISPTGTLTYTTATNANGVATVTVQLHDNGGTANGGIDTSAPQTFAINVTPVNDLPSFTKGPDQMVLEDAGPQSVSNWATSISAGPPDEASQSLTFVVTNSNPTLFQVQPAVSPTGTLTYTTATNANGNATVTVQLKDSGVTTNGGVDTSAAQIFNIAVTPVNDPPTFTKGSNVTVLEDAGAQTVEGWATTISAGPPDEVGQSVTFIVTNNNPGMFLTQPAISPSGTLTYTTATNLNGLVTVTVQLKDNGGTANGGNDTSAPQTFTISLTPVNDPPSFVKGSDQSVLQGLGPQTVTGWATAISAGPPDEASQTLNFLVSNNNTALFSAQPAISPTGTLTYTSAFGSAGSATVAVQLHDSGGTANGGLDTSAAQIFSISIAPTNRPPTLGLVANQTINELTLLSIGLTATDPDTPSQTLTYSLVSGPTGMTVNASSGLLTWTPTEAQGPSTNNVTVQVADNGSPPQSSTRSFIVVVNEVNGAPSLAAVTNQTVNELTTLTVPLSATDPDIPANTLTYSLLSGPVGVAVNPSSGILTWTPTEAQGPGTYTITVQVTDIGVPPLSDSKSFTVVVSEMNSSPALAAVANQTVNELSTLTLTLSASDADIPANTLTFAIVSAPIGVALNSSTGALTWTPTEAQGPGTYTITVQVTDNGVPPLSDTKSFTVTVNEVNSSPSLASIANQVINEQTLLTLALSAADPDIPANTLTYSLLSGPPGMAVNGTSGVLTWTPNEAQGPSTNAVTVRVIDNGVPPLSDTKGFTVVVNEVNSPPVLTAIPNQTFNELTTLTLNITAADPDIPANTLTYSLVSAPAGAAINATTGVFVWTPTEAQGPSTNSVTVKVTDNGVPPLSDSKTFTIVVNEVNSAPVLAPISDKIIKALNTLSVVLGASDSDVPANHLTFSLLSGPTGAVLDANTGTFTWTPTLAQALTTNTVTVRVTDEGVPPLSDTKNFNVVVTDSNSAPVMGLVPNQTINELTLLSIGLTATDPDGASQTLAYSLVSGPTGMTVNATSGLLTWTPTEAQGPSTNTVTVQVTDNGTPPLSDSRTFTVVVNEVNSAPVMDPIANQTLNELTTLSVAVGAFDSDIPANLLTYSLVSGPAGMTINASNGLLSWTPSEAQGPSTNTVTVQVTDNGVPPLSDTKNFTVVVNEVNSPPTLTPVPNQVLNEGDILHLSLTATDADLPANALTYALVSGPAGLTVDSATGALSWITGEADGGTTNLVTVRVTDNGVPPLSDTKTFTVLVNEVNNPPVLSAVQNQTINEGDTLRLTLTGTDPDIPPNNLTYSLVSGPAGAAVTSAGLLTWTAGELDGGTVVTFTVRVTDNGVPPLSDTKSFNVTINEVNSPPVLAAVADQTVDEQTPLMLNLTATDPDIPPNTLSYSLVNGPPGMVISALSGLVTWTPTEAQGPSTNLVTVRVTDNGVPPLSDTKSFTVLVNEVNTAPTLAPIANKTIRAANTLSFALGASDGDIPANHLTYSLVSGPPGATVAPTTGLFTWTPSLADAPSTKTVTVKVTDDGVPQLSDIKSFNIAVTESNSAPVLSLVPNQTVNEGSLLTLTLTATDPDGSDQVLAYGLVSGSSGMVVNSTSGILSWTPAEAQGPSTNLVTVQVSDNGVPPLSDSRTFSIVVNEVNSPPVLAAVPDQTVDELTTLTLTLHGTDPDIPANILTYTLLNGPTGMTLDPVAGALTWTPTEAQGPSTSTVTVQVTDNGIPPMSASRSFRVIVNEVNTPPSLAPVANQVINEGETLRLALTATDSDLPSNLLNYSLGSGPQGASVDPTSGVFTWTPTELQAPSTNLITIRVTDNGVPPLSDSRTFVVVVNKTNNPPVLAPIANQIVNQGLTLNLRLTASDPDLPPNSLAFTLISAPSRASLTPDGILTWPTMEVDGGKTFAFTVAVTDNGSPPLSDRKTFNVSVALVNTAPVLASVPDQMIDELNPLLLSLTASDSDFPSNTLSYSLVSGPVGMGVSSDSGLVSWTPTEAQGPSTNQVTVRVTDNGVPPLSDEKTFKVVVHEVNSPPLLAPISDKTVRQSSTLGFTLGATDSDLPPNHLTFALVVGPAGAAVDPNTGVFSWTPTVGQGGSTNAITVKVTDDGVPPLSDTKSFNVIVSKISSGPVLSLVPNQVLNELMPLTLTLSATDADGPSTVLTYGLVSGPTGMAVNPQTGLLTWTPSEAQGPSTNSVTVRVSDNSQPVLSDTRTFAVVVNEVNSPPALEWVDDQTLDEGTLLKLTVRATDPDIPANTLTYTLVTGPDGMSMDPATGLLTWTPNEAQGPSTNAVTVKVTDNGVPPLSDSWDFRVIVREVNSPPVLAPLYDKAARAGQTLSFPVIATDPDLPPNQLTFSLVSAPTGAALDPSTGVFTWRPTDSFAFTTNRVTVRVTDNGVPPLSATASFNVTVGLGVGSLALTPIPDQLVNADTLLTINNSVTASGFIISSLIYSFGNPPPDGAALDPNTGVFTWTPTQAQAPSTNSITIRVRDTGSPDMTDVVTFQIVVLGGSQTQPQLSAVLIGAQIVLSWPTAFSGFHLEDSDDIGPNALWFTVIAQPVVQGDQYILMVPAAGPRRFYRLTGSPTTAAPRLKLTAAGFPLLSWPSSFPGYTVEYQDNLLGSGVWSPLGISPTLDGAEFKVTDPAPGIKRFYRLRRGQY